MAATDPVAIGRPGPAQPLARYVDDFPTDLANAGTSGHTPRAYRSDLARFAAHRDGQIGDLDAAAVRHDLRRAATWIDRQRPSAEDDVAGVGAAAFAGDPQQLPIGYRYFGKPGDRLATGTVTGGRDVEPGAVRADDGLAQVA